MERIDRLKQLVHNVEYIWECQVDEQLKTCAEMKAFFTDCQTKGRIDPRDAVIFDHTFFQILFVLVLWRTNMCIQDDGTC
jgi:G:T-mismatch repair DNA endonuclease (very short patch repair protein)